MVIDDGTVTRLADDGFRWTAAHPNLRWLTENAHGMDVEIEDISEQVAALALQGPTSRALLSTVCATPIDALKYFRATHTEIAGVPVGSVDKIVLVEDQARVVMNIRTGTKLHDDSIASIKTKGLIGEEFVQISPGGSERTIPPNGRIKEVEPPVDLEEILSKYVFGKV